MATSRVDHLKPPRRYNGGQYVNAQGVVDPLNPDPSQEGPRRQYPLWDRGDAGYLESCSFAAKNFNGRDSIPGFTRNSKKEDAWGSEVPERKIGDGRDKTKHFDYTDADTYSRDTGGQPLPSIESIYALHSQKYFEYVPWRGRMISASRRVETPSLHSNASSPGERVVGGLFFEFEAVRTEPRCSAQAARSCRTAGPSTRNLGIILLPRS